jgi:hypothetical protein
VRKTLSAKCRGGRIEPEDADEERQARDIGAWTIQDGVSKTIKSVKSTCAIDFRTHGNLPGRLQGSAVTLIVPVSTIWEQTW